MKFLATLLAWAPSAAWALVGNGWKFQAVPIDGLDHLSFPLNLGNCSQESGYYFAQQFRFVDMPNGSYIGIQPRKPKKGKSVIHLAFSSFQAGTTTGHANCFYGADSGPGVSCQIEIEGTYCHTYRLVVKNTGPRTWQGCVVDSVTTMSTVIGEWTLPIGAGNILGAEEGFVEYYRWNDQKAHACNSLPKTEVIFYYPTSDTPGASGGELYDIHEYGDCIGQAGYALSKIESGYNIKVGF